MSTSRSSRSPGEVASASEAPTSSSVPGVGGAPRAQGRTPRPSSAGGPSAPRGQQGKGGVPAPESRKHGVEPLAPGQAQTSSPARVQGDGREPERTPTNTFRCACGHFDVMHDLKKRKSGWVRTACSVSEGPKATPCSCKTYQPLNPPE